MTWSRRERGFTLVEMVVVLVLLSVAAGLVLPAFTSLGTGKPTRPVDVLLQSLRDARRLAVERDVLVSVLLDPVSRRYRVDTTGLGGGRGTLADTVFATRPGTMFESDSARLKFIFFPTGAAIADSVTVRGDGVRTVVSVDPWTGMPRATAR